MASFRIHEDQENCNPNLRQKAGNMAPVLQKRSILGNLGNKFNSQNLPSGKQPLGALNSKVSNKSLKSIAQKQPPPVVPVAQFEAFKVYEDSQEDEENVEPPNITKAVPKVPEEEAELEKVQLVNDDSMKQKTEEEVDDELTTNTDEVPCSPRIDSPMSIEKSTDDSLIEEDKENYSLRLSSPKDLFFEIEEYRSDIYSYLREHELHNRPKPGYMRKQPDITYSMRVILVDWLVEVAQEYKLHTETLYLAINYVDRFLSYMSVVRGKLQLVGTAAMFIASKYEEIRPPDVSEFVYITDDTYTKKQVFRMEHLMLKVLSFDLSIPTPLTFITAITVATKIPEKVMYLSMYLSELSMLETDVYLETLPSLLAAASIAVARYICKLQPWTAELKQETGYEDTELRRTMEFLYIMFCKASTIPQQAIQDKYSLRKYLHVSNMSPRRAVLKLAE